MRIHKSLFLVPILAAGLTASGWAETGPAGGPVPAPAHPDTNCMAPAEFLNTLTTAGDWVIGSAPKGVEEAKITGVVFRESGMIDVALFRAGCLAAVVIVGKAAPDIMV